MCCVLMLGLQGNSVYFYYYTPKRQALERTKKKRMPDSGSLK